MTKEKFLEYCKEQGYNLTDDQFSGKERIDCTLYLDSLTSIPKGFNPVVGGDLYLDSLTSIPKGFNPEVGGNLWLDSLTSIPKGFNPIVRIDLSLNRLTSIPEGFNPEVKGNLYLDSLTEIPENWNPTNINGDIYIIGVINIKPILNFMNFHI